MSGGVDSSVAAALLLEQGCEVLGVTLFLRDGALKCVSEQDAETAARIAGQLGIEHCVIDARATFEQKVVQYFANEYAGGRTPSPCVLCNPAIKFGLLFERTREMGCETMATGHYARIVRNERGICRLFKNQDASKDQSYFLQRLTKKQLGRTVFPLQNSTKAAVQAYATELGLECATHPESQDLCFAEQGGYAELVEQYHPELHRQGQIVDSTGKRLGAHAGVHNFTIGQRRGTGVATGERYYVTRIDSDKNRIVMGPRAECAAAECRIRDINWIAGRAPAADAEIAAQPRYRHPGATASIVSEPNGSGATIVFKTPQFGIAPGQALAVYSGSELLGGGWIV